MTQLPRRRVTPKGQRLEPGAAGRKLPQLDGVATAARPRGARKRIRWARADLRCPQASHAGGPRSGPARRYGAGRFRQARAMGPCAARGPPPPPGSQDLLPARPRPVAETGRRSEGRRSKGPLGGAHPTATVRRSGVRE